MARLCKYGEIHDVGDVGKAVVLLMMTRMMVVVMMMMMMMLLVAVYSNLISTHSIEFSHGTGVTCDPTYGSLATLPP